MPKRVLFVHKLLKRFDRLDKASVQNYVEDLAEDNAVYEEILQNLNEGVILINAEGTVRLMNRQAAFWLGVDPSKSLQKSLPDLIQDSELSKFIKGHLGDLNGRVVGTIPLLSPKEVQLQIFLTPWQRPKEKQILILLLDVTAVKNQTGDEQAVRIETLARLASGVAHELGNPLNSISIHLALLKKQLKGLPDPKRESFEKTLEVLGNETSRLDQIIRNFLKATRKPPLRFRAEDINSILEEAIESLRPGLNEKKIRIDFKKDKTLPSFLVDRLRLYQAFSNLMRNALEAMNHGGVLKISVSHRDRVVMIRFKDEGSGIAEEDLPHIFEAYYTTKEAGSGLGLMTVFNAVREHGGRVEVNSRLGQGTTFTLLLPIRQPKLQLPVYHKNK